MVKEGNISNNDLQEILNSREYKEYTLTNDKENES